MMEITGVSMAARARILTDPAEAEKAIGLLMARYPEQKATGLAVPKPSEVRLIALTPTVISLLDYSKGFGHTDLVAC
ncbi:hypothetical protein ACMA5K_25195 [Bradyrhizobium diazoefficiens]|uniref:hypothetical protein n=1 Tax=Bradyrhizobium diazoefficiens TaxID=1355477 RepID=UPI003A80E666